MFDYLIIGAGFTGSVLAERIASQLNKKVIIVDKRTHVGGNAYDYYNKSGILVHKYGPHIFHTNDNYVYTYLSKFTDWQFYQHKVLAFVDGQLVPIPINMNTLNKLYGFNFSSPNDVQKYYDIVKTSIKNPKDAEEMILSKLGEELYEKFFKNYTIKQWNIHPKELSASVTGRIPTRTNRDDRYFGDKYQVMPRHGYNNLFKNMLQNKNISILLNTNYKDIISAIKFKKIIYTGPIDEYFDYLYGKLPYRSLQFEHSTFDNEWYQDTGTINYPNDYDFTRITEWKYLTKQKHNKTSILIEYPCDAGTDMEKFYPIPRYQNEELFKKYKREAKKLESVIFCGRLADYKYYNMDQAVARALMIFKKYIC
jgi:UDP-galactopyranose mutase